MAYIGQKPADKPLGASDITNDIINADKIADDSISEEHLDNTIITALSQKSTPADADKLILSDSADSNNLKYVLKSALGGGGTYTIYAYDSYNYQTNVGGTNSQDYLDIAGGNTVTFTPTSTDDLILISHGSPIYTGYATGGDVYMMLGTSSTLGSSDTKLNYNGRSAVGTSLSGTVWCYVHKTFILPCTGLTVGTQYYMEQAAGTYSTGNWWYINYGHTNASGSYRLHNVEMLHLKKE